MPWVRIDEDFARHPKVLAAGPLGIAMQVAALCYANQYLTDGFIPRGVVPGLIDLEGLGMRMWQGEIVGGGEDAHWKFVVDDLVRAGLWEEVDTGYRIHDYHDYQPTKAEVEEERKQKQDAGSKGGKAAAAARRRAREAAAAQASAVAPATAVATAPAVAERVAESKPVPGPVPLSVETSVAAAAESNARVREGPPPPQLEPLRTALTDAGLTARWDKLRPDERDEIGRLLHVHGPARLVAEAKRRHRPDDPAAFASAWLGHWRTMRPPGRLAAVPDRRAADVGFYGIDDTRDQAGIAAARQALADRKAAS